MRKILSMTVVAVLASACGTFPSVTLPIAVPSEASGAGYNVPAFNQDANSGTSPSVTLANAVPSEASGAGYNVLAFNQDANSGFDFDVTGTATGHMWYNGLWQGQYNVSASNFTYNDGDLVLKWTTAQNSCPAGWSVCPIATISTGNNLLTSYRAFGHGYFEMIARVVSLASGVPQAADTVGQWAGFWLLGLTTGQNCIANGYHGGMSIASPAPTYSEIDTLENQTSISPITTNSTYHRGSSVSGCGSSLGTQPSATPLTGTVTDFSQWHKYGLLWTNGTLDFFVDDVSIGTVATTAETEAQLHTLQAWMAEGCGFTANDLTCLTNGLNEFDLHIQSIREWSCTAKLAEQLSC